MKLTAIAITAALMSATMASTAMADESGCTGLASLAGSMMKNRQVGTDLSLMVDLVSKSTAKDLAMPILLAAYEQPRFDSPSYQQKAISDFKNEVMLSCMKGVEL